MGKLALQLLTRWLRGFALPALILQIPLVAARAADRLPWLTNLDTAKKVAAANGKDLFIVFTGSNWCGHCMTLDREDLNTDEFASVAGDFVLVRLDYRADADNNKVPDRLPEEQPAPHLSWKDEYEVRGFPTVYLADPSGGPYAMTGDVDLDAKHFTKHVRDLKETHAVRDAAFAKAEKLAGIERAKAIDAALDALEKAFADGKEDWESTNASPVAKWYHDKIDAVIQLDASNEAGLRDRFTDLLNRAAIRNEEEAFDDKLRKLDKEHTGTAEALHLLDKRIAETHSTAIRNRARHARLINLEWADRNEEALAYARELAADQSYSADDRRFFQDRIAFNLHHLNRDDEALAVYDQLIAAAKDNPQRVARYLEWKTAVVLVPAKRYNEALDCCDRALQLIKPQSLDWEILERRRADLLILLDRPKEVRQAYEALIASKTLAIDDRAECLSSLAEFLEGRGFHDDALESAHQAQQILDREAHSIDAKTSARIKERLSKIMGFTGLKASGK